MEDLSECEHFEKYVPKARSRLIGTSGNVFRTRSRMRGMNVVPPTKSTWLMSFLVSLAELNACSIGSIDSSQRLRLREAPFGKYFAAASSNSFLVTVSSWSIVAPVFSNLRRALARFLFSATEPWTSESTEYHMFKLRWSFAIKHRLCGALSRSRNLTQKKSGKLFLCFGSARSTCVRALVFEFSS